MGSLLFGLVLNRSVFVRLFGRTKSDAFCFPVQNAHRFLFGFAKQNLAKILWDFAHRFLFGFRAARA